jgi:hypothetical protein
LIFQIPIAVALDVAQQHAAGVADLRVEIVPVEAVRAGGLVGRHIEPEGQIGPGHAGRDGDLLVSVRVATGAIADAHRPATRVGTSAGPSGVGRRRPVPARLEATIGDPFGAGSVIVGGKLRRDH